MGGGNKKRKKLNEKRVKILCATKPSKDVAFTVLTIL